VGGCVCVCVCGINELNYRLMGTDCVHVLANFFIQCIPVFLRI